VAYFEINIPVISNRVSVVYGVGINRMQYNETVIVLCKSIENVSIFNKLLSIQDKTFLWDNDVNYTIPCNSVMLSVKEFCFELKPLSKNRTRFECNS